MMSVTETRMSALPTGELGQLGETDHGEPEVAHRRGPGRSTEQGPGLPPGRVVERRERTRHAAARLLQLSSSAPPETARRTG